MIKTDTNMGIQLLEAKDLLNAKILTNHLSPDFFIDNVICSELMSDILAYAKNVENTALLTSLNNAQVLRTAEMVDIKCVIFARNKPVNQNLMDIAEDNDIILLSSPLSIFAAAGRLYNALVKSSD